MRSLTSHSDVDYVVLGHVTRDVVPGQNDDTALGRTYTNGGTATFSALTAHSLGRRVGVVTQVSSQSDLGHLHERQIDVVWTQSDVTTTFENRYAGDVRSQYLNAFAGQISLDVLPEVWRKSRIMHIGPIYQECPADIIGALAQHAYLGITPQGWFREATMTGQVAHQLLADDVIANLGLADAVVISHEDIENDDEYAAYLARYCQLLIVTSGWQGGVVYEHGELPWSFPAPQAHEVDPTGAGDIFATVFFLMHADGQRIHDAVRIAACAASQSVSASGLEGIPSAVTFEQCMKLITM